MYALRSLLWFSKIKAWIKVNANCLCKRGSSGAKYATNASKKLHISLRRISLTLETYSHLLNWARKKYDENYCLHVLNKKPFSSFPTSSFLFLPSLLTLLTLLSHLTFPFLFTLFLLLIYFSSPFPFSPFLLL